MSAGVATWTAARLFERYFAPLYPPELRADLARARTTDANPADNPRILAQLDSIADAFATMAPIALGQPLVLDRSDASVHRLAAALTREARERCMQPAARQAEAPALVQLVTHGAVYVGACAVAHHGGRWLVRSPLWESLVRLPSRAGVADLALFQWWLKSLADNEIGEPHLGDRYRLNVELPTAEPERLPILAPPDRRVPRLRQPRYHELFRHLRAHLPELRDLGAHFPSPQRFDELAFAWLDFLLVGGGRMVLMHGPSADGVRLLWLEPSGFSSAAYFPADAMPAHSFPEYRVVPDGDKLVVIATGLGAERRHELWWWGVGAC